MVRILLAAIYILVHGCQSLVPVEKNRTGTMTCKNGTEEEVFVGFYHEEYLLPYIELHRQRAMANYEYTVDMTPEKHSKIQQIEKLKLKLKHRVGKKGVRLFNRACLSSKRNQGLYRNLLYYSHINLNETRVTLRLTDQMARDFARVKICPPSKPLACNQTEMWSLRDDIYPHYASTKDEKTMRYLWLEWRRAVNRKIGRKFKTHLYRMQPNTPIPGRVSNHSLKPYEKDNTTNVLEEMEDILAEIRPFYEKLHAFARFRLSKIYPDQVKPTGTVPAHLLGTMYSQEFHNMYKYLAPFPSAQTRPNASAEMFELGWTAHTMAKTAEKFFKSIGFPALPQKFWQKSVFKRPKGKNVMCHPTAVDIGDGEHFMIRMCAKLNLENLDTMHHELGHIYYYIAYSTQPVRHKGGASPAFHEGIGDAIFLSAAKTSYLQHLGLMQNFTDTNETELNDLMEQALRDVPFIPSAFIYDKWKFDVFETNTSEGINDHWWELRQRYQGLHRPIDDDPDLRNIDNDVVDPIAKYHVASGIPYSRYFFSRLFTYMVHQTLCNVSQPGVPLHQCSIYGKTEAGDKLWKVMAQGQSVPWQDVLKDFTGYDYFSTQPFLDYYKPLIEWLNKYIEDKEIPIGW